MQHFAKPCPFHLFFTPFTKYTFPKTRLIVEELPNSLPCSRLLFSRLGVGYTRMLSLTRGQILSFSTCSIDGSKQSGIRKPELSGSSLCCLLFDTLVIGKVLCRVALKRKPDSSSRFPDMLVRVAPLVLIGSSNRSSSFVIASEVTLLPSPPEIEPSSFDGTRYQFIFISIKPNKTSAFLNSKNLFLSRIDGY